MGACLKYLCLALALVGCSHATQLSFDRRIPAAMGNVQVKTGPNGNTKLKVLVEYLAPPSMIRPGATTYVVWARNDKAGTFAQNLGALQINDKRSGSLETVTPLRSFVLFLSAEDSPDVQSPTGEALMTTPIERQE